jgi:hypothetical protein
MAAQLGNLHLNMITGVQDMRRPLYRQTPYMPKAMRETQEEYHARKQREQANADIAQPSVAGNQAFQKEVVTRLRRMETRLVSGMEKLGVELTNNADNIAVGDGTITITSLGTTVKDLLDALGNETGSYDIVYNGKTKCQITTWEK